jgi:hypothetical protein
MNLTTNEPIISHTEEERNQATLTDREELVPRPQFDPASIPEGTKPAFEIPPVIWDMGIHQMLKRNGTPESYMVILDKGHL